MPKDFVDFAAVKERVSMEDAIRFLNLKLTKKEGDQLRYACPHCKGDNTRALSINVGKGVFRCFASGGKGGTDSIALVAHVKGIRQREAAVMLDEHFRAPSRASEPEGRRESEFDTEHPAIEALGLSAAAMQGLGGGYKDGRVQIPLRSEAGVLLGHLGIATSEDQAPLLLFPDFKPAAKTPAEQLRKLFRVV